MNKDWGRHPETQSPPIANFQIGDSERPWVRRQVWLRSFRPPVTHLVLASPGRRANIVHWGQGEVGGNRGAYANIGHDSHLSMFGGEAFTHILRIAFSNAGVSVLLVLHFFILIIA